MEKTDFLFSTPTFLEGISRTLDIGGTYNDYSFSSTPDMADHIAIFSDWLVIGEEIRNAIISKASR